MESRGQVWALHGPPWPSNLSKLTENTIGELSVKSQLATHHYHKAMAIYNGANLPLVALTESEESCYRNQTCQSWRKYSVEYDSVLDQQSISGKTVSLILCVWKPCYMKSGHIFR